MENQKYPIGQQSFTKMVNEIYLSTVAKGITIFNSTQITQLSNIAHQCPLTGGRAVYRARDCIGT